MEPDCSVAPELVGSEQQQQQQQLPSGRVIVKEDETSKQEMYDPTAVRKKSPTDFYFGRVVGEGSFSTVYLAKDVTLKKEVAVKVCNKALITREKKQNAIMRERDALMLLTKNWSPKTPFFVRLYATMQDSTSLYFVLTYAKHGDMLKFIKKMASKQIDVTQIYAAELVQAVEHLHRQNIIHRDLKPENILLDDQMHILITDFGSTKILSDKEEAAAETNNGEENSSRKRNSFVGTAQYVSPEILTNKGSSKATDLWAIGCILYQMVSGLPPFQSQSEYQIFQKILKLDYTFHEGFNEEAKDLVKKLLVIEPEERLGAQDVDGYPSIKNHRFFAGVDFDTLHENTPELIKPFISRTEEDPIWSRHESMEPGLGKSAMNRILKDQIEEGSRSSDNSSSEDEAETSIEGDGVSVASNTSHFLETGNIFDLSDQERKRLLEIQKENNEFHRFVEGNLILKQGILDKKKGLWSRRRMFLLTEGPRLFYVDPKEMVLKGEIPWSEDMKVEMRNFKIFFVHTPNRVYYLIDNTSFASKWCEAIETVRKFYFPSS